MLQQEDWKGSALRYLKMYNVKNQLSRGFRKENLTLKLKDTKEMALPKYFSLVVDLMLVADLSEALARLIMWNPTFAESIFVQALEEMIINDEFLSDSYNSFPCVQFGLESTKFQRDQWSPFPMHVSFQLKGIPSNLFHKSLASFKSSTCSSLIAFKGILISLTSTSKYTRSGVYSCSDNMCPESMKRRIPLSWKKNPKECHMCSSNLVEHAEERDIGNVVKAIVTISPTDIPFGSQGPLPYHFERGIMVKFYDGLASELKLGEHYDVAGYVTPRGVHAYYVQKSSPPQILDSLSCCKLNNILRLRAELDPSPWSFFIAVASQLCSDLYPRSSFLHLKRGLLLSLISLFCKSRPIHVLAVGSENLPAHRFMSHASQIAPCNVVHSHQQPVMGKTRWQEEYLGGNILWLDAGSLYLAQGGICYMGDWMKYHKETHNTVLSAIERRQIAIVPEKKTLTCDFRLPLKSAVWTLFGPKKNGKLRPLIDVFGIPFTMEMDVEGESDVINHLLFSSPMEFPNWSLETKMILQNLKSDKITVDSNATKLIQDYFVASRRCRGLSNPEHCLPIGSIDMIVQMAEAHARISFQSTVTQADALAAVNICEEALTALYGQSLIPAIPPLRISEGSNWSQFSDEVNSHMKKFGYWLDKYLNDLIGGTLLQMPREE